MTAMDELGALDDEALRGIAYGRGAGHLLSA